VRGAVDRLDAQRVRLAGARVRDARLAHARRDQLAVDEHARDVRPP
jgi:hypothetical protein